jgi:Ser/Thr protein kinase RdoA (MazF antagonist)
MSLPGKREQMHDSYFPVTHSILSASALLTHVQQRYDIGDAIECRFLNLGLNDTYLLRTSTGKYILRVYRENWRSLPDILYELDMLLHLHRKRAPISFPLAMKNGSFLFPLQTLEGSRQAVLFTYAEGESPAGDEAYSLAYGRAAAQVHNALDDFSSQHARFRLDLDHLLDEPLRTTLPVLEDHPQDQADLLRIAQRLKEHMSSLPVGELEWGACHGDFHGGNAHITKDQQVTFFDFDCAGPGWRAYDLAVFRWARATHQQDEKLWEAYLAGYTQHRTIRSPDLAAVPLFVALRQIWLIGLHSLIAASFGYGFLDRRYFESHLHFLKKWVAEHIDGSEQEKTPL